MKNRCAGFSLVEVTVALAIFATVGAALIGLLGGGMNVARDAVADAEVAMLIENVQTRLTLDAEWPGDRVSILFDNSGAEVQEEAIASFRVGLKNVQGPGFKSRYFDTVRVSIERLPQGRVDSVWMLQRARLVAGKPLPAP